MADFSYPLIISQFGHFWVNGQFNPMQATKQASKN